MKKHEFFVLIGFVAFMAGVYAFFGTTPMTTITILFAVSGLFSLTAWLCLVVDLEEIKKKVTKS